MKFNSMWECNPNKPLKTPVIDGFIREFTTLRPLAKDEKGKILNDTRFDLQKEESKVKLCEYVESFRDECDIYKILERCARSGDFSVLMAENNNYGDSTLFAADRPVNDENLANLQKNYNQVNPDVKAALLSGMSDEQILQIIKNLNKPADNAGVGESEVKDNA